MKFDVTASSLLWANCASPCQTRCFTEFILIKSGAECQWKTWMQASGTAPLHYCSESDWTFLFPSVMWSLHETLLQLRVASFWKARTAVSATFTRERLCVKESWFQILGSFLLHVRPFLCSSANAARCLNGRRSPSCNTRAPTGLCSIRRSDGSEREEEWKWQRKTLRPADKVRACESPVVLWPGCRNVEAFPARCTNEAIASDSWCHCRSVFIDALQNLGNLPVFNLFIFFFQTVQVPLSASSP